MLKLGINENVILQNVAITESKSLEFTFLTLGAKAEEKVKDIFDELDNTSGELADTGSNTHKVLLFTPLAPSATKANGDAKTDEEKAAESARNIVEISNICKQFLGCFMTTDKMAFRPISSTLGYDGTSFKTALLQQETLIAAAEIIFIDFVEMVKPFLGDTKFPLRLIMVRQAPAKSYLAFRRYFIKDNPIVESMSIPLAATSLKFTDNEIKKGLNQPLLNAPDADAPQNAEAAETFNFEQ